MLTLNCSEPRQGLRLLDVFRVFDKNGDDALEPELRNTCNTTTGLETRAINAACWVPVCAAGR